MTWQPIETAPKDGTQILVSFVGASRAAAMACARWKEDGWRVGMTADGVEIYLRIFQPTHWQRLPKLPKE